MEITAVEPRRKGLSALYIDGEFAMKLDTRTLLENGIRAGKEISDEELHELIELSGERRAKEKALRLISYRDHSSRELEDKIKRTCDERSAEKAVERLEELGLVDDERFALSYAEKLVFSKNMSKRLAKSELMRKGIDRETAERILEDIEVDPREQIRTVLLKKYGNLSDEKIRRRAFAALQRRGFCTDDIVKVMKEFTEDTEESDYES